MYKEKNLRPIVWNLNWNIWYLHVWVDSDSSPILRNSYSMQYFFSAYKQRLQFLTALPPNLNEDM